MGLFGIVRSSAEALTTRPANEVLCVWSSCLHVCMCVCVRFALRYHYALLYQGFSVEQVICLDISSCSEPEMRAMQILREREGESIWSNSNTDAAPVDLSVFVSLPLLLWTVLRSIVSSCFFNRSSRWRMF